MMTSNSAALGKGDACCPISADAIADVKMMAVQSVRFIGAIQRSRQADVDLKHVPAAFKARNTTPSPAHSMILNLQPMKPRCGDRALCMLSVAAPVTRASCFDRV